MGTCWNVLRHSPSIFLSTEGQLRERDQQSLLLRCGRRIQWFGTESVNKAKTKSTARARRVKKSPIYTFLSAITSLSASLPGNALLTALQLTLGRIPAADGRSLPAADAVVSGCLWVRRFRGCLISTAEQPCRCGWLVVKANRSSIPITLKLHELQPITRVNCQRKTRKHNVRNRTDELKMATQIKTV